LKALVLKRYRELILEDVPEPVLSPDGVLVRVKACGICGSDVHGMDGSTGRRIPPLIMGHEASGVVEETGVEVTDYGKGDRVTFDSTVYCGVCPYCRSGRMNLCDRRRVLGVACDEYRRNGAFAEYVAVPQRILHRLPDGVTFEQAAMVEPLSVAFHAVGLAGVSLNETAVVFGAGVIGLLVVQLLKATGCGRIIAVDVDADRLALASELGAGVVIDPRGRDVPDEIFRLTGGADKTFDAAGVEETVTAGVESLKKGGTLVLIGNLTPTVGLPLQKVVARQLTVLGSCASNGEYPACLDMIGRGAVDVDRLISVTAPLSEGPMWFDRLRNREPGLLKVILKP